MNAFALNLEEFGSRACEADAVDETRPLTLAGFAPKHRARIRSNRAGGVIAVAVIHGLLALAYVVASPRFYKPADRTMVVNLLPEIVRKVDPPPPIPTFEPPAVYIPMPIMPEVVLSTPPPPPVITIAPTRPTPVEAPIATVPPPEPGRVAAPPISATDRKAFAAKLFGHLNKYKRYPAAARMRREEGVVSLRFTMDRDGHVLSYELAKTSGSDALDREAQDLLARAQPLPAIPIEFGRDTLDLVVPVEFFLH